MQAQKEAPADMQCKDKFLLQSVVVSTGATAKDITAEMVTLLFIPDLIHFLTLDKIYKTCLQFSNPTELLNNDTSSDKW